MTREELDKDMIESIEMWLHECEPKYVEKELAWLEELRTRLFEEEIPNDLEEAAMNYIAPIENEDGLKVINFSGQDIKDAFIAGWKAKEESEKPINPDINGLEEEVKKVVDNYTLLFKDGRAVIKPWGIEKIARHFAEFGYRYGFLEGAKTQREEDDQLVDTIYQQGIEKGKDEMKEQAVGGELCYEPHLRRIIVRLDDIPDGMWNGRGTRVEAIIYKTETDEKRTML